MDLTAPSLHTPLLGLQVWQWMGIAAALAAGWAGGRLVAALALRAAARAADGDRDLAALRAPARVTINLLVALVILSTLSLPGGVRLELGRWGRAALAAAFGWLVVRVVAALLRRFEVRLAAQTHDPVEARSVRTQVVVLRRLLSVIVALAAAALALTQFEVARNIGAAILASAGLAGLIVGFAAQRSLATLLGGMQLSITQPLRIGDAVVIEGEWGWVEEITLTYVVVRIWDLRRLVVPIARLLEQPFQNWTRGSPELLGTVILHADYAVPVERVRQRLGELVRGSPHWNGRVHGLQVVEAGERTIQLRAVVSADDAGKAWDLRCEVREGLVSFLQELDGGRYLPRTRSLRFYEASEGAPVPDRGTTA